MIAVIFSPEALCDLDEIWLYIAQDNVVNADRFIDELQKLCEGELALFPGIGTTRNYLEENTLAFPHGSYMIYYRVSDKTVEIIRIMHGSVDK